MPQAIEIPTAPSASVALRRRVAEWGRVITVRGGARGTARRRRPRARTLRDQPLLTAVASPATPELQSATLMWRSPQPRCLLDSRYFTVRVFVPMRLW